MDPRHLFMDGRLTGMCVYCGGAPDTRDHVPSKVLLDEPYPRHLPVVDACERCNSAFSLDEQYVACFIECVICGTAEPSGLHRSNIRRIIGEDLSLQHRIKSSQSIDLWGELLWQAETDRVRKVITKLAIGHVAYELFPQPEKPIDVACALLPFMSPEEKDSFENTGSGGLAPWPEIGTRAFHRAAGVSPDGRFSENGWIVVQPGRYRYSVVEGDGVLVRMVLSEYLAGEVYWE